MTQTIRVSSRTLNDVALITLSGTEVRSRLREGRALPEEFTRPEVAAVLAEAFQEVALA